MLNNMTPSSFLRRAVCAMLAYGVCQVALAAAADDHPAVKHKFNLPPSAELSYSIKARQSGLTLDGNALVKWSVVANKFMVATETRALLVGKIMDAKSEGAIDEYGLAPATFTEKRFRKDATTTSFNRPDKTISFSQSAQSYPLIGGEQDRNSAIWQLIAVARGAQGKFKAGTEWFFFVAGQHDAQSWSFKVAGSETVRTPLGNMAAVHILKMPPPDAQEQRLDIWLAPALEWYPVRLRFSDPDGDFIEQTLENVSKRSP